MTAKNEINVAANGLASIAKRWGATGVLAIWVTIQQVQLSGLQQALKDCYITRPAQTQSIPIDLHQQYAVLPKPIKIEQRRKLPLSR